MSNFYQKLCDAIGAASVREQEPMSAHTTFRAGGPARYFVTPEGEKAGGSAGGVPGGRESVLHIRKWKQSACQ